MFLNKKNFIIVSLVFVFFAFGFFQPCLTNAEVVDETYVDFSDVEIGSTGTRVLHMTNLTSTLLVVNLSYSICSCGTPFSIQTPQVYIFGGETVNVEVYFTPSSPGECSAILYASYGGDPRDPEEIEEIEVTGTGFAITTEQTTMDNLLDSFNAAVGAGLKGAGPGESADNRLNALKNMIIVANHLIESGDTNGACGKLQAIYKKIDGQPKPQDFVEGPGLEGLQVQVEQLMIGCK